MTVIKEDELGVYAQVGGYIARPEVSYCIQIIDEQPKTTSVYYSSYKKGEKTEGFHFRGTSTVGIGKIEGKGQYREYWKINQ